MGAPAAVGAGLTAATGLGTAINSGIKGNRAAQTLDARMAQSDAMNASLMNRGLDMLSGLQARADSFANPALAREVLNRTRSSVNQLADRSLANQAAAIFGQDGTQALMRDLYSLGGNRIYQPGAGLELGQQVAPSRFTANEFDFQPVRELTDQALQAALAGGERARTSAREEAALAARGTEGALDAALAGRGLARDSGVAGAALSEFAAQTGRTLTQLERDLANSAQDAALQGAQLDASNALQLAGLGSQYNLGLNQLLAQVGMHGDEMRVQQRLADNDLTARFRMNRENLMANQYTNRNALAAQLAQSNQANALARAQGLAGLQGLNDSALLAGAQALQNVYQSNYLAPQLALSSALPSVAGSLISGGMAGAQANLAARQQAVSQAGGGKGAGLGAMTGGISMLPSSPKVPTPVDLTANQPFARVL